MKNLPRKCHTPRRANLNPWREQAEGSRGLFPWSRQMRLPFGVSRSAIQIWHCWLHRHLFLPHMFARLAPVLRLYQSPTTWTIHVHSRSK